VIVGHLARFARLGRKEGQIVFEQLDRAKPRFRGRRQLGREAAAETNRGDRSSDHRKNLLDF
jgi:hypothetical protein